MRHGIPIFIVFAAGMGCQGTSVVVLSGGGDDGGACETDAETGSDAGEASSGHDAAGQDAAPEADVPDAGRGPHGGTWPTYAHDLHRTSRADGRGAISAPPQVAWTSRMGGTLGPGTGGVADVDGDGRPNAVTISGGRVTAMKPDGSTLWQGPLAGARSVLGIWNLDGVGTPEVVVDSAAGVLVLGGGDGHELTTLATPLPARANFVPIGTTGGVLVVGQSRGQLAGYDFRQGTSVSAPLWTGADQDPADVAVGDVNGDGKVDIVQALNAGFQLLDPLTGLVEFSETLPSAAFIYTYQLVKVDASPGLEILVVDPSYIYSPATAIYLLGVRNGALVTLWSSAVASTVPLDANFATIDGAVVDLDADGTTEAVYSQWDGPTQTWTTRIVDAATGTPIAAISGELVQAVADVDGDGKVEIAVRSSPLADGTPARSDLRVYDFDSRASPPVAKSWTLSHAHVVTASPIVASHSGGNASAVAADFDPAPGTELLVGLDQAHRNLDTTLAVLRGDGTLGASYAVPASVVPSVLWWGDKLTSASSQRDVLEFGDDGLARELSKGLAEQASFPAGSYANWLNVYALDATRTTLVMSTSNRDLQWLDGSHLHADGTPYQRAHVPGVVDTSGLAVAGAGMDNLTYLPGTSPTLVAYEQGETTVTMVGMDVAGVESWRTPLAPGAQVLFPGPYVQDLTGDGTPDLLVAVNNINSLESFAIFDGRTGTIVRSTPLASIGAGGDVTMTGSLVDVNGDKVPDLVVPVHTIGQVAIDLTASPMAALWTISGGSPAPTYSGTIAAAAVDPQGLGLLRFNGNVGSGPYARYSLAGSVLDYLDQGLVNLDGTDRNVVAFVERSKGASVFDMVSAGMSGVGLSRLRRIAGDTIATVWTEYLANGAVSQTQPQQPFALHDPIAVDVDGDGADEVVLGSDDGRLYAVHASDGSLAFSLDLGAPVAHVIAADIDLDPAVELVASLADGRLVAIDGPGKYTAVQDVPPADAGGPDGATDAGVTTDGGDDGGIACGPGGGGVSEHSGCSCRTAGASERGDAAGLLAIATILGIGAARRRRAQGRCVQRGGGGEQEGMSSIATR